MKTITVVLFSALLLAACSNPTPDLKSPCVGGEDSPCDRRAPQYNLV
jgi:PBP1b-binding outer membrane lipoprotein LpoB